MSALMRALRLAAPVGARQRSYNVVAIPAREKMPVPEMIVHGAFFVGALITVPTWVLVHIKEYRGIA